MKIEATIKLEIDLGSNWREAFQDCKTPQDVVAELQRESNEGEVSLEEFISMAEQTDIVFKLKSE